MALDYGRQQDLIELTAAMRAAKTVREKEYLEQIAYRITNQTTTISSLRQELMGAFRAKDLGKVRRLQEHIHRVRLEETRGASWGNNRGNRNV